MPFVAGFLLFAVAQARDTIPSYVHDAAPEVRAGHLSGDLKIDGRLDEPAWAVAPPVTSFTQLNPDEGRPASERTEVRVLIGSDALYIGARLFDSAPRSIRSVLARRDDAVTSDYFQVFLDPYHDHLTAVRFRITPGGAIQDALVDTQSGTDDVSWDPVWEYAARIDSAGWTVELKIPLSQLRYNAQTDARWGIQFERFILRKGEDDFFAFTPKREHAGVNRYGHLVGLGRVPEARRLELVPYGVTRAEYTHAPAGDPFRSGHDYFGNGGADLKYGVTSNLTLDATVNPDFGQVEVDSAVVNLSAFETFFPEKRPFFVEGGGLFQFGSVRAHNLFNFPQFFFSRRIGRMPERTVDGDNVAYVDPPTQTAIRTAGKLTGHTRGGWSIGILDALTATEETQWQDTLGRNHLTPVEPLTNYFVGRVRKDLDAGNSTFGALVTAVNRHLTDSALASLERGQAYVAGLDFTHGWRNRDWSLDGTVVASHVAGTDSSIALTQRSSARYYQRPDARTLVYDPSRTSLDGLAWQVALSRNSAEHWLGSIAYQEVGPGFEANDLGFQTGADRRALSTLFGYQDNHPHAVVRNWFLVPFENHTWNFDGDLVFGSYGLLSTITFANFWNVQLRHDYSVTALDDRLTRGGPLAQYPHYEDASVSFTSDSRRTTQMSGSAFYLWDRAGQWNSQYSVTLDMRPSPATHVNIGPSFSQNHSLAQYVTTISDNVDTATFGARYVFATLDQTQLSLLARLDWTFTPRLSFQLFLQPLIASARFRDLKELARPKSFDFVVYGRDRGTVVSTPAGDTIHPGDGGAAFFVAHQDFNLRSLRGNAVLRWEWRPGSTLFVVWQQSLDDQTGVGDFVLGRDLSALFNAHANNILAVKASYWIGM
ncbi:MAG TPA: DUF5916 domain-containing protein [Gemmatimonadales bacterium]|nr:DUF5916 domain-containing protein [Gemmatimonadales bacterium]